MKKNERKAIQQKLFAAFITILEKNDASLTHKTEKAIKKTLKKIAKKTEKEKAIVSEK
jgi:ABC-type transport system involved in Fe-S cluster assembly fused permease/ATPase subunit